MVSTRSWNWAARSVVRPLCRPHQVGGGPVVALRSAGQVYDRSDPVQGGVEVVTGEQVGGDVLDAVATGAAAAAENAHRVAGVAQERGDQAAEGARTAGDQDG
jgi:hypothetical protein